MAPGDTAVLRARLTRARGERTQGEAAQLCGVSKQGWNVWEGGRSALTTEHVCKIARALGVDAAWLAFGDDPEPVPLTGEPLTWEGYGARVREARDKKGLSLDAAATALGFANRGGPHKIETERVRLDLALDNLTVLGDPRSGRSTALLGVGLYLAAALQLGQEGGSAVHVGHQGVVPAPLQAPVMSLHLEVEHLGGEAVGGSDALGHPGDHLVRLGPVLGREGAQ